MLAKIRQLLSYQLTVAEFLGIGLWFAIPYLIVGAFWSTTHADHLHTMHGADLMMSFLGSVLSWPVLLFSDVCMV
jgi:hypothetical protein